MLKKQIEILSTDILIISDEYTGWEGSQRRIDLLGIDKSGKLVVIELKRDKDNSYMDLQAMRYAAMASTLSIKNVIEIYNQYCESSEDNVEDPESNLANHLNCDMEELDNKTIPGLVKIYLVNEDFSDREVTSTVLWLNENYNLDITCIKITPYSYNNNILVDVQQIIPLTEANEYQIQLREKKIVEKSSKKDFANYLFQDETYNKRKLVYAVIHQFVKDNPDLTYENFQTHFPQKIKGKIFYKKEDEIIDPSRFFNKPDELINFDNFNIAINNQWGKNSLPLFLDFAKKHYQIEKVDK